MAAKPKEKRDYAREVADRVIAQLRDGTAPWIKPWAPGEQFAPINPTTGKAYRGMNAVWLMMQGRADPRWMTYRQAASVGAQVRQGEKSTLIQYWMWEDRKPLTDADGKDVMGADGKRVMKTVKLESPRVMNAFVFNAGQIDGLPELVARPVLEEFVRHQRAEAMLSASPAPIRYLNGDGAYYMPTADTITLPERSQFMSPDAFYATALHEIGHSTGHASRLDRDLSHPFGSEGYAREELRAEIASLMLGEELGIGHDPGNHASYIKSWIKVLEDDPREIFRAAADAEKIKDFMLALEIERSQDLAADPAQEPALGLHLNAGMSLREIQDQLARVRTAHPHVGMVADTITDIDAHLDRVRSGDEWDRGDIARSSAGEILLDPGALELLAKLAVDHPAALEGVSSYLDANRPFWRAQAAGELTAAVQSELRRDGISRQEIIGALSALGEFGRDDYQVARMALSDMAAAIAENGQPNRLDLAFASDSARALYSNAAAVGLVRSLAERHPAELVDLVAYMDGQYPDWRQLTERQARIIAAERKIAENWAARYAAERGLSLDEGREAQELYRSATAIAWGVPDGRAATSGDVVRNAATRFARRGPDHAELVSAIADASRGRFGGLDGDWYVVPDQRKNELLQLIRDPGSLHLLAVADQHHDPELAFMDRLEDAYLWHRGGLPKDVLKARLHAHGGSAIDFAALQDHAQQRTAVDLMLARHNTPSAGDVRRWGVAERGETPRNWRPGNGIFLSADARRLDDPVLSYVDLTPSEARALDDMSPPAGLAERVVAVADLAPHVPMTMDRLEHLLGPADRLSSAALTVRDLLVDVTGLWDRSPEVSRDAVAVIAADTLATFQRRPQAVQLYKELEMSNPEILAHVSRYMDENAPNWRVSDVQHAKAAPERRAQDRVRLTVPYVERAAAKEAGARWDKEAKTWYAPKGADLSKLDRWAGAGPRKEFDKQEVLQEFKEALLAAGFVIAKGDDVKMDGKWHRLPVEDDKKGERSGAYKGFLEDLREGDIPAGFIENHLKQTKRNWYTRQVVASLSPEQRAARETEHRQRNVERHQDDERKYALAADAVIAAIADMTPAPADHPYLVSKGVPPYGALVMGQEPLMLPPGADDASRFGRPGHLVVPVQDIEGRIWGAQAIGERGRKSMAKGCKLAGCFHVIGELDGAKAHITAEGFATGAEIHRLTGLPVAVAFNASNLETVARLLAEKYPEQLRIVAGDNDHVKEAAGKRNVGREVAERAAEAVRGAAAIPQFESDERGTDFNDLRQLRGDEAVLKQLREAYAIAMRKSMASEIRQERESQAPQHAQERDGPSIGRREQEREAPELAR